MDNSVSTKNRRDFLKMATIGAVGAGTCGLPVAPAIASPALQTHPKIRWRLTSSFPKSLDNLYGGAEFIAKRVRELTQGQFDISVFAAGELAPALGAFDVVSNGTVEMAHTTSYYYIGKNEAFAIASCLPFGMNARQQIGWMLAGDGNAVMQKHLYDDHGVVAFPAGNTGAQMGGWLRYELHDAKDIAGLKIRVGGLAGKVFEKMGAIPQQIAGGDIYPAIEKGVIDAAEWIGPYDDEKLGFHKIVPYYYYPGWWEGGPNIHLFINQEKWHSLPAFYQEVLKSACQEATFHMWMTYDMLNPPALKRIAASGTKIKAYPPALMQQFYKKTQELYTELCDKNKIFKTIFEHHEQHRKQTSLWLRFSDGHYDNFMFNLPADELK